MQTKAVGKVQAGRKIAEGAKGCGER